MAMRGNATTLLITLTVHLSALKTSVSGKDGEGVRLSGLSSPRKAEMPNRWNYQIK